MNEYLKKCAYCSLEVENTNLKLCTNPGLWVNHFCCEGCLSAYRLLHDRQANISHANELCYSNLDNESFWRLCYRFIFRR